MRFNRDEEFRDSFGEEVLKKAQSETKRVALAIGKIIDDEIASVAINAVLNILILASHGMGDEEFNVFMQSYDMVKLQMLEDRKCKHD